MSCSLLKRITIKPCSFALYQHLGHFHYRSGAPGPVSRCFGAFFPSSSRIDPTDRLAGIIIYSMPALNSHLRNIATAQRYLAAPDLAARALLLNREIRTISRVIIDPQFRSIGLAVRLIRQTMPQMHKKYIEASAVMGHLHPMFTKAGMTMYTAPADGKTELMIAAFEQVGIARQRIADRHYVGQFIRKLNLTKRRFITSRIRKFFVAARSGTVGSQTRLDLDWILPRLCQSLLSRPAYFLWQDPDNLD